MQIPEPMPSAQLNPQAGVEMLTEPMRSFSLDPKRVSDALLNHAQIPTYSLAGSMRLTEL